MENVELKSIVIEIKNSLEGLKSRSELAEKWINKFKDRSVTDYASWRTERKTNEKNEHKCETPLSAQHICNVTTKRKEQREKGTFKEIMAENVANLLKSSNLHIQEAGQY